MGSTPSLDIALEQLRLRAMRENYDRLAAEASSANLSYERYLLALAEQELAVRELARQRRCIQQAHLPVLKELADFDWQALPSLNRARILALAQGSYIEQAEPVLLIGNPGQLRITEPGNQIEDSRPFLRVKEMGEMTIHGQDIVQDRFPLALRQTFGDKLQILAEEWLIKHVDFVGGVAGAEIGGAVW